MEDIIPNNYSETIYLRKKCWKLDSVSSLSQVGGLYYHSYLWN